ncbi:hypothetical protein ACLI4Z_08465 [Natrialbaceae archaeon A-arb3/5]
MEFEVSREVRTFVTLEEGAETTACNEARADLMETLGDLEATGTISNGAVTAASVHEYPAAPLEPYTVSVEFTVAVVVEAESGERATIDGEIAIDDALERADLESISYRTTPVSSPA